MAQDEDKTRGATADEPRLPRDERIRISGTDPTDLLTHRDDIFYAAVAATRMPMTVTDPRQPDNPIVFCNPAFTVMTGYGEGEVVGRNCRFLNGPETDRDVLDEVRRAVENCEEIAVEILNYRKDGSTFWNALYVCPVFSPEGELIYYFGSQLDVSRRRDAEEALRQSQKMEALGQLTGGIAHDFNNLLQVMLGYLEMVETGLDRDPPDPVRLKRGVGAARAAASRAATLTQQLLAFARKQRLEGAVVNLNELLESVRTMIERALGDVARLEVRLAPHLWNCRLDRNQAEVALLNLVINARDAMARLGGGRLVAETRNATEEELALSGLSGPHVAVSVTDTGTGMSPAVLARVMEPFFTTKEEGRGTGLGLSMVYGFVRQSGGVVRLDSEPGRGTTVHMLFPATDERAPAAPRPAPRASDRRGTESILVVEDRPEVAGLAAVMLEEQGYRVTVAHDAKQALERINGTNAFDLLFTDLIMPGGVNGVVLAREVKRLRPKMKVLLTTGQAHIAAERGQDPADEFDVINKPYNREALIRRVRTVLDGATGIG
ncbi:histidine kinase famiy protein [Roseomonas sp. CCTCC AB2023176]|uniref:histidine kinase famiy protein n=1 Tax=Roseomonas sp. CCTCC AB2023176 TaxID=3342640 RepID=UPI0035D8929B